MKLFRAPPLALLLTLSGCTSTGVGNPYRETTFDLVSLDTSEPDATDPDAGLAEGALEHAVLSIGRLELSPCDGSASQTTVEGPIVVDLITGEVAPKLPPIPTPEGGFCSLSAPLAPARRPPGVAGRSIFLSGQRSDGVRFLIYAAAEITLRVEARDGQAWGEVDGDALLWAFRPHRWVKQAEADSAEINAQEGELGVVVIDSSRHPLLYLAVLARIGASSGVYRDLNKNGQIDRTELDRAWVGVGLGTTE